VLDQAADGRGAGIPQERLELWCEDRVAVPPRICASLSYGNKIRAWARWGNSDFDADRRLAAITAKGSRLETIARVVPFESFRAEIEAAVLTPVSEKKSTAGRKPIGVMVMFECWCCNRFTSCPANRSSIKCAIGCRSRGFSGSASRTAFRTARRCGCSKRRLRRPIWLRSYLSAWANFGGQGLHCAWRPDGALLLGEEPIERVVEFLLVDLWRLLIRLPSRFDPFFPKIAF
jgi:hypothetical protein